MYYLKWIISLLVILNLFSCSKKEKLFLAKVGKATISPEQYRQRLEEVPLSFQAFVNTDEGRYQVLEAMIKEELLIMEARKEGLNKTSEVKTKLEDLEKNLLLSQMIREAKKGKIKVTDEEIVDYYESHKEEFSHPRQIRVSHILLPTYEEAQRVLMQLERGRNFVKLAQKKSIDTGSAKQGGDLGFFRKGEIFMLPEFEKVAFQLKKKGDLSTIVKTQLGFHIIKLTDIKELEPQNLDQAKEEIAKTIEKDKFNLWVDELRTKFKVKINYNLLNQIFLPSQEEELNNEEEKSETDAKK